jgi:hypothetical protein
MADAYTPAAALSDETRDMMLPIPSPMVLARSGAITGLLYALTILVSRWRRC